MKTCRVCGIGKALEDFHRADAMKDGHRNECKACLNARHRAWYQRNRERSIAKAKSWRIENPGKYAEWLRRNREENKEKRRVASRVSHLKRKYGLTEADYDFLTIVQGGRCRICNEPDERGLHVDHDHASGIVRGLLCGKCNRAIGLLHENPGLFEAASHYLRVGQLPLACGHRPQKRSRVRPQQITRNRGQEVEDKG